MFEYCYGCAILRFSADSMDVSPASCPHHEACPPQAQTEDESVRVHVCVCVRERERERERGVVGERWGNSAHFIPLQAIDLQGYVQAAESFLITSAYPVGLIAKELFTGANQHNHSSA